MTTSADDEAVAMTDGTSYGAITDGDCANSGTVNVANGDAAVANNVNNVNDISSVSPNDPTRVNSHAFNVTGTNAAYDSNEAAVNVVPAMSNTDAANVNTDVANVNTDAANVNTDAANVNNDAKTCPAVSISGVSRSTSNDAAYVRSQYEEDASQGAVSTSRQTSYEHEWLPGERRKYYRNVPCRVFVNRSLHLEKIKYYGFDMDYTLAEYSSPQYEQLGFELLQDRLVEMGYPEEIREFQYDPNFPTRGLWFDRMYGNLLKVDGFGNILVCVHGFSFLKPSEIYAMYPNKFIQLDESRVYVMNTLFNLPEVYMIACLIDFFSNSDHYVQSPEGVKSGELYMSYQSIFQDLRAALDWVHMKGSLKARTVKEMARYVQRDKRLPLLLDRMKQSGAFLFLLTNSEYWYTREVMTYLLNFPDQNGETRDWKSYFHAIVVDACKPSFFSDGSIMRQVDTETGALRLGTHTGTFKPGQVYSGGSCDVFTSLLGAKGKDVMYVGDHIFGDILKSKKIRGWRTFLVVPELVRELHVWTDKNPLFSKLQGLDVMLGDLYKNLDSSTTERPDLSKLRAAMREVTHEMDLSYGMMGSLFRSGSRQTHFSTQVSRYADVYASTLLNLIYYPFSYMFRAPSMLMPHESTVTHEQVFHVTDAPVSTISRAYSVQNEAPPRHKIKSLTRANSQLPHARAETPKHITHHHDDDDDEDEESDDKST